MSSISKNIFKTRKALALASALFMVPMVVGAASDTQNTVINANLGSSISMTTSTTVNINITPTPGGSQSSASDTVAVATNNSNGYTLTLANSDAARALTNGSFSINAHTGTQATPSALANNSWGYRVDGGTFGAGPTTALNNASTSTQTFAGVPINSAPNTIKTTASTSAGDNTIVWYSVKADSTNPNGTYADTVTYTATTNP